MNDNPGILKMIRAPFLSSIIAPIVIGTLWSAGVKESFDVLNFIVVLLIGIGLHVATNVYNDIYDTLQGTDKVNVHRNESSGGSGVLLDNPELMGKMYFLARTGLVVALLGTIALTFLIKKDLRVLLWVLFLVSAFFSKYYTAPPVKLAYRGWGEVSVWLAFGPMAILIAAVSQNMGIQPHLLWLLPITGLSTSSILLVGQMIDLDADRAGGKHGVASRMGSRFTSVLYVLVQVGIAVNILALFAGYPGSTWPLLLALLPYILLFPKAAGIIWKHHDNPDKLKAGAKLTVLIHLVFSVLLIVGFGIYNFLN
ncbi:prenyltransferase [Draconibacterium halophilum]|uniref:Prenyltransferase n=1 Tax=Draconibacterium halophilum TaxID=2706887 RepID=A0A6C0RBD5_9BACT|nr:prenyltransferase [Draconibacterium halophilum]QIA06481.1 prenyltransferase [Draconibacterium halophilum]